tara:strand:+ start:863 stop:2677 length:1815 start_codon:yes stop_codon:yes gene_type:complete
LKNQEVFLLSTELDKLPNFLKNRKLAGLQYTLERFKIDTNKNLIINDERLGARSFRYFDNIASKLAENYYKRNKNSLANNYINEHLGEDFLERLIKKEILVKFSRLLRDIYLANILIKKYKLNCIYIYNDRIDLEFFQILKKYFKFSKKIKYPIFLIIKSKFKKLLAKTFFFLKILYQLEILFLISLKNWKKEKIEKFTFATRLDDGLTFQHFPYSPEILFKENTREKDVIFYADNYISYENQKNLRQRKNYKIIIYINDLMKIISFRSFYKKIYKNNFVLKFSFLKILFQNSVFSSILSKSFEQIIFWDLFYNLFKVKKNIVLTIDTGVTFYYGNKKRHGVNTSFIYPHFTELMYFPFYENLPSSSDWSYLRFDEIRCDRTTKAYLDDLITYQTFNEIGFLFQNYIENFQIPKINFLNKANLRNNKNRIIFFYDASIGTKGVMSLNEYKNFLIAINNLLYNSDFIIGLKVKDLKVYNHNPDIFKLFINLKKHQRFVFLNEINIEKYLLLSVPDLIISPPISTVIFEAICLKKKVLIINLNKRYKNLKKLIFNNKKVLDSVENIDELIKKINILFDKNIEDKRNLINQKYFLISNNNDTKDSLY